MLPDLIRDIWPLVSNSIFTILVKAFFPRFFIIFLIARCYGSSELGSVILALSIIDIAKTVSDLGIDTTSINLYTDDRQDTSKLFSNILAIKLISSSITYALVIIIVITIYPQHIKTIIIFGLSLFTSSVINCFISYYQSKLGISKLIPSVISGSMIFFFLIIIFIYVRVDFTIICLLLPFTELLIITAIYIGEYQKKRNLSINFDLNLWRILLKTSTPVLITNLIIMVYLREDIFLISSLLGEQSMAEYGATVRLVEILLFLAAGSSISIYAAGSRTLQKTGEVAHIFSFFIILICGAFFFFSMVSFFSTHIIYLFLPKYPNAAPILSILSWAFFLKFTNTHLTSLIYSYGSFLSITKLAGLNLIVNTIAILVFITILGVTGAAYAQLLTEGVNTLIQILILRHCMISNRGLPGVPERAG